MFKVHDPFRWCVAIAMLCVSTGHPLFAAAPPGYVDASAFGYHAADATAALQAAIDTGSNVYVPNVGSDWIVSPIQLTHSDQEILFENGVVVRAKTGAFQAVDDALFTAAGQSNIKLTGYGAMFVMNKSDYQQAPYASGEWRHGINLLDVSGFEVLGLTIRGTGGDGIYVGTTSATGYSQNVTIKDVRLDDNHRQGISVISVENMLVDNVVILNTAGTAPEAGIDFEANLQTQRIVNVRVQRSIIASNNTAGILFASHSDLAQPITVEIDNVTLFANHADGIRLYESLPGVSVTDTLVVGNGGYGLRVGGDPPAGDLVIDHTAVWGNGLGALHGYLSWGDGSFGNVEPIFVSTDVNDPYFLYLDPATPLAITQGAGDGGYLGARPVHVVPEPGAAILLGGAILFAVSRFPKTFCL